MKKTWKVFFYLLFLFGVAETALRIQQHFGPFFDFEFRKYERHSLSSDLNHKPGPDEDYNPDGIQNNRTRPGSFPEGSKFISVLFMGDSFIQGYPPGQTVPQYVWEYFQTTPLKESPLLFWNAGYSSYAPLIYTVQAQKIIPVYKPDFVVIDIDESDLVDDDALYRPLAVRDAAGKMIAVKPTPPYQMRIEGYHRLRKLPFYTLRLLGMWIHKARLYFFYKSYNKKYKGKYYADPMSDKNGKFSFNLAPVFDRSPEAGERYAEEIANFRKDLVELAETLIRLTGSPEKILFLYHPHLYQLTPDPRGFLWRANVPPLLTEISEKYGVDFYDATADLKKDFGERPDLFYREWDMHFYPNGMQAYSRRISEKLSKKLSKIPQE